MSDLVRVVRVLQYIGPREWVQETLDKGAVPANGVKAGMTGTILSATLDFDVKMAQEGV